MITQEQLKEHIHYNIETGVFTRKKDNYVPIASKDGRIAITVLKKQYQAHKLVFMYLYGYIPENSIKHLNGNKSDNRLENLQPIVKYRGLSGQEELKEWLNYDATTGNFTWIKSKQYSIKAGDIAGTLQSSGYLGIRFNNKDYRLHRLAWLYVNGYFPKEIDHINHDRSDNRLINLREVTHIDNGHNISMRKRNTSGFNGVWWDKSRDRWATEILVKNKKIFLGRFKCKQAAINARKADNAKYNFHYNHGEQATIGCV